ncbi:hypothetical protein HMPREF9065_01542 [Aggregatibacter sp. oral taxon 458 str. W10330]|nr:hypothetical protein HMPREF9065_01542 [Aggregatibacter sp. oral taxon 458 str. W10330]
MGKMTALYSSVCLSHETFQVFSFGKKNRGLKKPLLIKNTFYY